MPKFAADPAILVLLLLPATEFTKSGISIDGKVCLVCLQPFFVKQTNYKLSFAQWANSKWNKENCLDFRFPFSVWNNSMYIYNSIFHIYIYIYIYTENGTDGIRQLPFVSCKWKMEMANFCSFAANGNRKRKLVFLGQERWIEIDDCCFGKHAHLWGLDIL